MQSAKVLARSALIAFAAFMVNVAFAQTTGTIIGTVQDASDGSPVAGALVIAQSPSLQGEQTALSSQEGTFRITLLPVGEYTVLVQADGYRPTERTGISVALDKTVRVTLQLVPEALRAEDVVVTTEAPVIDQGSNTSGAVITEEFHRNIPTGRNFAAVLNVAPGAGGEAIGTTFRGSSSPENAWIIDGINTTDIANADQRETTGLPNDFVKQVEVKTGGYQAEYGRATGGVINVVTKSGGNEFHGDVFVNYSSDFLTANTIDLQTEATAIEAISNHALDLDFGFDLGGYIIKDKLWFFVGLSPFLDRFDYTRNVRPALASGELGDVIPELTRDFSRDFYTWTRMAKLTYNVSEDHSAQFTYFGDPGSESGVWNTTLNGTEEFLSSEDETGGHNLGVRWTSKLFDKSMLAELWYGLKTQKQVVQPIGDDWRGDPSAVATIYNYAILPDEFADVAACAPTDPADPSTSPCATEQFGTGPTWFIQDDWMTRNSLNAKFTNFFEAGGQHALKYGGDIEFNRFLNRRGYANDWAVRFYEHPLFLYRQQALGTYDQETGAFTPEESLQSDGRTRNTALFLQDSYSPFDGLNINAGLRWETQALYGHNQDDPAITIDDSWSPRIGATYDWTGRGRSKVEAFYGRFYEAVPMDINVRAFSEEVFGFQYINADGENVTPDLYGVDTYALGGGTTYTMPGLKGQYIDEYSAGIEYEVLPDLAVGATLVHRALGRAIEDVSPDDGHTYIIANPGDEGSIEASIDAIHDTIQDLGGTVSGGVASCDGVTGENAELCSAELHNLELAEGVSLFPRPERTYDAIELMVRKNFSRNWYMISSVTFSKTLGNYPGLFAPENGQLDPNITSQYDLPDLLVNREGPLRSDRPVYFKLDGYYLWDFGLITGLSFRANSGIPQDVLGGHQVYGEGEAFLLPRGIAGRTDPVFDLSANLGYDFRVSEDVKVNLNVNVFNILNQQTALRVDNEYTLDFIRPVVGGELSDIESAPGQPVLLNTSGEIITYNPSYGQPLALAQLQNPLQLRLGLRVTF